MRIPPSRGSVSEIKRVSEGFLSGVVSSLSEESLKILRCPYLTPVGNVWRLFFDPAEVPYHQMAALREYLPRLLKRVTSASRHKREVGILGALCAYGDFDNYPSTQEEARTLAIAVIFYISQYSEANKRDATIEPYVRTMLNTWLQPPTTWTELPTLPDLCRRMFGDLWCAMELPEGDLRDDSIDELVERQRPPFHNGFIAPGEIDIELPDNLGISS